MEAEAHACGKACIQEARGGVYCRACMVVGRCWRPAHAAILHAETLRGASHLSWGCTASAEALLPCLRSSVPVGGHDLAQHLIEGAAGSADPPLPTDWVACNRVPPLAGTAAPSRPASGSPSSHTIPPAAAASAALAAGGQERVQAFRRPSCSGCSRRTGLPHRAMQAASAPSVLDECERAIQNGAPTILRCQLAQQRREAFQTRADLSRQAARLSNVLEECAKTSRSPKPQQPSALRPSACTSLFMPAAALLGLLLPAGGHRKEALSIGGKVAKNCSKGCCADLTRPPPLPQHIALSTSFETAPNREEF